MRIRRRPPCHEATHESEEGTSYAEPFPDASRKVQRLNSEPVRKTRLERRTDHHCGTDSRAQNARQCRDLAPRHGDRHDPRYQQDRRSQSHDFAGVRIPAASSECVKLAEGRAAVGVAVISGQREPRHPISPRDDENSATHAEKTGRTDARMNGELRSTSPITCDDASLSRSK